MLNRAEMKRVIAQAVRFPDASVPLWALLAVEFIFAAFLVTSGGVPPLPVQALRFFLRF